MELGPGPKGAWSSLLRILGILGPTEGRVRRKGVDFAGEPNGLRASLDAEDFGVHPALSARRAMLEQVGLADAAYRRLREFSVGIAQALLDDPALLIVDEPTATR